MLTFAPTIFHTTSNFELPRPVSSLRISDAWDFEKVKVPLRDGDTVSGHSRNGTDIRIEGQIGTHGGQLQADELAMFDTLTALRTALHVGNGSETFILSLFNDGLGQHRYFDECSTTRVDFDLSNKHVFTFSIQIHAANPQLQQGLLI